MQVQSHTSTVRTTTVEATLSEAEVEKAIAAYVIANRPQKDLPPADSPGVEWTVNIDDRTGEASVTIRHEQQIDG